MKSMKTTCQIATAVLLAASLTIGVSGSAIAAKSEPSTTKGVESAVVSYPTPSKEDIAFYGTDDPETVYLLNQMSAEFAHYGANGYYDDLLVGSDTDLRPGVITTRSWNSFANCVGNGLAKSFGLDVLKRAFNSEVRSALKSHKWKVASSIMHRNLTKILGKKGASFVIKKIASKALPGGLPGQIAWQVGKCGFKEIW